MNDYTLALRRERRLLMLLGWVCIALLAGALYLQYVKNEDPCPLCIIQRYFFCAIGIFAFLAAGIRNWRGVWVLELLIAIAAAGGVGTAARHLSIQMNPGFSCSRRLRRPCPAAARKHLPRRRLDFRASACRAIAAPPPRHACVSARCACIGPPIPRGGPMIDMIAS